MKIFKTLSIIFFCLSPVLLMSDMSYLEDDGNTWDRKNNLVRLIDGLYGSTSYLIEDKQLKQMERLRDEFDEKGAEAVIREYSPHKLFDGKENTAWVEGAAGPGTGEGVLFVVKPNIKGIKILPGYAAPGLFEKNNRPKEVSVEIFAASPDFEHSAFGGITYNLKSFYKVNAIIKDSMSYEQIDIPFNPSFKIEASKKTNDHAHKICVGITIVSVYKGSLYDDTCISEIKVLY